MMRKSSWLLLLLISLVVMPVSAWGGSSGRAVVSGEEGPETYAGSPTAAGPANTCLAWDTNPAACASNAFVTDQAADGSLVCTQPSFANLSSTIAIGQVPDDFITAAKVAFNYAASLSEGGAATDLNCIACVSASEAASDMATQAELDAVGGGTPEIPSGFTLFDNTTFASGAHAILFSNGINAISDATMAIFRRLILTTGSNHACLDVPANGVFTVWDYLCTTRGDSYWRDVYLYGGANRELVLSSQVNRVSMASDWKVAWNNSTIEGNDGSDEAAIEMQSVGVLKLSDAMRLNPRSSPPVTCGNANTSGVVYYDSDSNEVCACNGTTWTGLIAAGACA